MALVALAAALGGLAACGGGEPDVLYTRSRYLQVFAERPVVTDRVVFQDTDGWKAIRVTNPNRTLVAVNLKLVNDRSAFLPLFVTPRSAQIGDPRGERIFALDPFEAARPVQPPESTERQFAPFIWGNVDLNQNYQVQGWMVFDVPKDLLLSTFWWNDPEPATLTFQEYR